MKQKLFSLCAAIIFMFVPYIATAQEDIAYWGKEEAYLMRQASYMYNLVDEALTENPPVVGAPTVRRLALYNLDAMLHETKYDNSEPFKTFVTSRMSKVIEELQQPVKKGMKIYKIYNDGFIANTRSVTIAFDLVRGMCNNQQIINDEHISAIANKCDILFLSHNHDDHVDRFVVDCFIKAGKPIIAATEILNDIEGITHLRSENDVISQNITLQNGKSIAVKIFPGHQSKMMCNVYVVTTPENITVAHTGDQYNKEDLEWIASVKYQKPAIDALLINCWSMNIQEAIRGFNPRYVFTGHENEMGHTIDHREAFWLTFNKLKSSEYKYVVMAWGEWFSLK